MSAEKNGGPAFPSVLYSHERAENWSTDGMSLRDYFAGQALLGILSGPASRERVPMTEWFDAPPIAYQLADAMLSARASQVQP